MGNFRRQDRLDKNVRQAFLLEALDHVSAQDVQIDGTMLIRKGAIVDPRTVALLAGTGIDRLLIHEKPKVSILAIGNDLIPPGVLPRPGKEHDSSLPALQAALESIRLRPVFVRRLVNEPKLLRRLLPFALNQCDMMILAVKEAWTDPAPLTEILRGLNAQIDFVEREEDLDATHTWKERDKKIIFYLAYDSELILKSFSRRILPAIQSFMGYAEPAF